MKNYLGKIMLLLCLAFALTACGAKAPKVEDTPKNEEVNQVPETVVEDEKQEAIVLNTSRGEITLDKAAVKVVSLDWTLTEELVLLGVQPIGAADKEGYATYMSPEVPLSDEVVDVGTRNEPNLEVLASLKPDLILGSKGGNEAIYDQLSGIAPTLEFDMNGPEGYGYELMSDIFLEVAKAVGKVDEAKVALTELEAHIAEAKSTIEEAGHTDFNFVVTQAYNYQNITYLRMFSENALMSQTLEKMGLINDWKPDTLELYAFNTIELEGLAAVQDSNFLYILSSDGDIFGEPMAGNSTWNALNFVKENRTYALSSKSWPFGGPVSTKEIVDTVVEAIVNE